MQERFGRTVSGALLKAVGGNMPHLQDVLLYGLAGVAMELIDAGGTTAAQSHGVTNI
jgi:hypothetical protein